MRANASAMTMHRKAWRKSVTPYSVFDAWRFLQTRLQCLHDAPRLGQARSMREKALF